MKNAWALLVVPVALCACGPEKSRWLTAYQQTKCAQVRLQVRVHQAQARATAPERELRHRLAEQQAATVAVYAAQFAALGADSAAGQRRYQQAYRQLTDAQSARYGHVSTPGYARALAGLGQARDQAIQARQVRRQTLQNRLRRARATPPCIGRRPPWTAAFGRRVSACQRATDGRWTVCSRS